MMKNVAASTAAPIGRLTKKIQRQSNADQQPAQGGPGDRGQAGHRSPDAERRPAPIRRERHGHQGQRLRHEHGRAQALHRAEADQPAGARREPARGRGGREDDDPGHEHGARSDDVAQPARRDHQDREHQRVRVQHPQHVVKRRVQPVDHVGDGDVDDRQVKQRHEEPKRHHDQDGPRVPTQLIHARNLNSPSEKQKDIS
jgi:hypothetical protein